MIGSSTTQCILFRETGKFRDPRLFYIVTDGPLKLEVAGPNLPACHLTNTERPVDGMIGRPAYVPVHNFPVMLGRFPLFLS